MGGKFCKPKPNTEPDPLNIKNDQREPTENETESDYRHLYKILLIGDQGIGKTSLILRYSEGTFPTGVGQSIGVDFKLRTLKVDGTVIKLQMWDTAGQEQFRTISSSYYRGAHAVILGYAINDAASFDNLQRQWMLEVERYACDSVAKIIVGFKSELESDRSVTKDQAKSLALKLNVPNLELSAKTGTNEEIEAPFRKLASMLMED